MKLKRMPTSTAETAEYEGFYEGRRVMIRRSMLGARWDGYVWDEAGRGHWSLIAENYPSMSFAVYETQRTIQARILSP